MAALPASQNAQNRRACRQHKTNDNVALSIVFLFKLRMAIFSDQKPSNLSDERDL